MKDSKNKAIRRILFKIISITVILSGVLLLALNIPRYGALDDFYDSKYRSCKARENQIYEQQGHYETVPRKDSNGNTLYHYEELVSDYNKKDCMEEATKLKQDEQSSIQFLVIIGIVATAFGIILLFLSFI